MAGLNGPSCTLKQQCWGMHRAGTCMLPVQQQQLPGQQQSGQFLSCLHLSRSSSAVPCSLPSLPPSWFPSTLLCSAERHLCLCSWILTSEPFQQPNDCPSTLSLRWITPSICVCKGFRKIYQARRPPSVHCHYRALCCKAAQPNPTQRGAMLNPLEKPPICVGVGDHLCFQGRAPGPCFTHVLTGQCQALAVAV